ncbi:MAG: demethoxyubiquinone hydroxylase family protein [Pseudomonadota bacterium]
MTQGLPHLDKGKRQFTTQSKTQTAEIHRMIRVNQAGEFGAKRIYEGQLSVLGNTPETPILQHMLDQELDHLKQFDAMMISHRVRPTALTPIWRAAGFALGAATARISKESAMACTAAVEEVIDQHYASQEQKLGTEQPELKQLISKCRQEEREHKELSLEHGAKQAPAYPLLHRSIKAATRVAIWLSSRI